ncbi:MAG: FtsX-like permease family protein, partial [Pseudomonadota bacterium]
MLARLSHRFFRRHPGQLLLALIGIAAGIAVVTGVALLRSALLDSLDAASSRLAGEQSLSIRAETAALSVQDYAELSRLPGAPDWVPVLRIPVRIEGQRFEIVALDPLVGSNDPSLLLGPGATLATAIDINAEPAAIIGARTLAALGLDADSTLQVERDGLSFSLGIAAVLAADAELDRRLLMDIAQAQALFGLIGELSELLVSPGSEDWLQRNLPAGLVWQTAPERRDSAARLTAGMRANLTAMSLLALATGLFVVYSVLNFLIVQRRHSFGMLRALGMTHRKLAQLLIGESLSLAALGGLAGLVIGTWLADRLLDLVAVPVGELYGQLPLIQSAPSWGLYALIWCLGLLAALLVTLPLLFEALRVPPGRLVRSITRPGLQLAQALWLGIIPAVLGIAVVLWFEQLGAALVGLFLVLAGLVVMIPVLGFGLLVRLSDRLPRNLPGRALALLQSSRPRLAPALAALTLALALTIGMAMMILGFRGAVDDWVERLLRADLYVSAEQGDVQPAQLDALAALPGVEAWSSVRQRRLADGRLLNAYDLPQAAWAGFDWLAGRADPSAFAAGRE